MSQSRLSQNRSKTQLRSKNESSTSELKPAVAEDSSNRELVAESVAKEEAEAMDPIAEKQEGDERLEEKKELDEEEEQEVEVPQLEKVEEPLGPSYGSKRYSLVDSVLKSLEVSDRRKAGYSAVRAAAEVAQAPYRTLSIQGLGSSYTGPPKYLRQRDAPLEIPPEVVRRLFQLMDLDLDDKVSLTELINYIQQQGLAISTEKAQEMFEEAASKRIITHEHQRSAPLSFDEIFCAVKGRYA